MPDVACLSVCWCVCASRYIFVLIGNLKFGQIPIWIFKLTYKNNKLHMKLIYYKVILYATIYELNSFKKIKNLKNSKNSKVKIGALLGSVEHTDIHKHTTNKSNNSKGIINKVIISTISNKS